MTSSIIWLTISHLIVDIYSGFINPLMPYISANLGFSMASATLIMAISHICSSLLQPVFGFYADNILKRFFIFWGLILASIFIPMLPNASNIYFLIVFMILGSIGVSFFHPQAMGFVNNFSKEQCSQNMGMFISAGALGFALGPLIASLILEYSSLKNINYASIAGLILALLMFKFVPKLSNNNKITIKNNFVNTFKEIFSNKQMDNLIIISIMKSLITNSTGILLPFLWKSIGRTPSYIGLALFLFVFAGAISSYISPKLEKKFGCKLVIYISLSATFPMIILLGHTYYNHPIISILIYTAMGFTTMLAQPVVMVLAQKTLPKYKSIASGFINGFSGGIIALLVSVLGILAQNIGIIKVLTIISLLPLITLNLVRQINEGDTQNS